MAIWRWTGGALCEKLRNYVEKEWFMMRLTYFSLFYNSLTSWSTVVDSSMEPVFWFVDHFVRYLGPAFVLIVVGLTTSVVVIFYTCLLPHKYAMSIGWTCYHLVFGHWLLCNIVFHYFKAAFTDPGHPPPEIPEVTSICKSCIAPKPPRCHHCSVCNKCILRMDHHCPWMNNCVGLNNHRYFFLFCVYMWLGTIYVSISAYPLFYEHMYGTPDPEIAGILHPFYVLKKTFYDKESPTPLPTRDTRGMNLHHFVVYEFMLCSAVSLALGILVFWHGRLISLAETSIEMHINRKEASRLRRMGLVYKNPYDFGIKENWKIFLGINTRHRSFFWHVLLPSSHKSSTDGLRYHTNIADRERELMLI